MRLALPVQCSYRIATLSFLSLGRNFLQHQIHVNSISHTRARKHTRIQSLRYIKYIDTVCTTELYSEAPRSAANYQPRPQMLAMKSAPYTRLYHRSAKRVKRGQGEGRGKWSPATRQLGRPSIIFYSRKIIRRTASERERERVQLRIDGLFRLDRPELDYSQEYLRERNGNLNQWMCTAALAHIYTRIQAETEKPDPSSQTFRSFYHSRVLSLKLCFLTRRRTNELALLTSRGERREEKEYISVQQKKKRN